MSKKIINNQKSEKLALTIVDAMMVKQGENILTIDLSHLNNLIAKYFVICHAKSSTQVNAIADYIEESVKKTLKEKVWHGEGHQNSQWILLDYADVVVHVFQQQYRDYYKLEELWADGKITYYSEDDKKIVVEKGKPKAKVEKTVSNPLKAIEKVKAKKIVKPEIIIDTKVKGTVKAKAVKVEKTVKEKESTKLKSKPVIKAKTLKEEKTEIKKPSIKKVIKTAAKSKQITEKPKAKAVAKKIK